MTKEGLDEMAVRCKVSGCGSEVCIVFVSPSGKQQAGYCKEHYGDGEWIEEQNLYSYWRVFENRSRMGKKLK